jgi:hypothetical protein
MLTLKSSATGKDTDYGLQFSCTLGSETATHLIEEALHCMCTSLVTVSLVNEQNVLLAKLYISITHCQSSAQYTAHNRRLETWKIGCLEDDLKLNSLHRGLGSRVPPAEEHVR